LGRGWLRHLTFSLPYGLGLPLYVASLCGIVAAFRRARRPVSIVGTFVVAYYVSIGSGLTVFARYTLPLVPVLCASAAFAVERLAEWVSMRNGWRRAPVLAATVALVALPSLVSSARLVALMGKTDTRVLAGAWLTAHVPSNATLYESGREYVKLDIGSPRLHRWHFDSESQHFVGATPQMFPDWLVVHESPLADYTPVPPAVERLARNRYRVVKTFTATTPASLPSDYDQQDAFFLPLRNFGAVERPGTNVSIYVRRAPLDGTGNEDRK
jgi:hypothetical protein